MKSILNGPVLSKALRPALVAVFASLAILAASGSPEVHSKRGNDCGGQPPVEPRDDSRTCRLGQRPVVFAEA